MRFSWASLDPYLQRRLKALGWVNTCGPQGLRAVPDRVFGMDLTPACEGHDFDYLLGGTEEDRRTGDRRFHLEMRARARKATDSWSRRWLRPFYTMVAWRYYMAVRWFGAHRFQYRDQPLTRDQLIAEIERGEAEAGEHDV